MSKAWREIFRKLPAFPAKLPVLNPAAVPADPNVLFADWLEAAIASGARQPHAMTFTSIDKAGFPVGRTLILKDINENGYQVSTHRTSRKGQQLAQNPKASMVFFWRESGRQVRATGEVVALDKSVSQADWESRPSYTGKPNPDWQVYSLVPTEWEFLQSREDRQHTRVEYTRDGEGWTHDLVHTPAG